MSYVWCLRLPIRPLLHDSRYNIYLVSTQSIYYNLINIMFLLQKAVIIDDDRANNFLCKIVLEDAKFAKSIDSFIWAEEALAHLKDAALSHDMPDVIFLDISMPRMDGWGFLEVYTKMPAEIRAKTKLFMLSSSMYDKDIMRARSYDDVVDFIAKPMTIELLDQIRKHF